VQVDCQTWWHPPGEEAAHIHMGGNFPLQRQVSGVLDLDIKIQLHDFSGVLRKIVAGCGGAKAQLALDLDVASHHWEQVFRVSLDTTKSVTDGWYKLGLTAMAVRASDGLNMNVGLDSNVEIVNGKVRHAKQPGSLTGATSWMPTGVDTGPHAYCNAHVLSEALPQGPISGMFTVPARLSSQLARTGVKGFATVDPNVHGGDFGKQQRAWQGQSQDVAFDTTELPNGLHKFMVRSHDEGLKDDGTLSAVFVFVAEVAN